MRKPTRIRRKGHAALRNAHASLPGQIYLVTFATHERHTLFMDHEKARIAAQAFTDPRLWTDSKLLAWILMPDHWHGLIELGKFDSLPIRVQQLKSNAAREVRITFPTIEKVWEKGFHDRALRQEERDETTARHLLENPLRAGLAEQVGDYPDLECRLLECRLALTASRLGSLP